jgi:hypothetical protein
MKLDIFCFAGLGLALVTRVAWVLVFMIQVLLHLVGTSGPVCTLATGVCQAFASFCLVPLQVPGLVGLLSTLVTGVDLVLGADGLGGSKGRVGTYHTTYRLTWVNAGKLGDAPLHRRVLFPAAGLILCFIMMLQILCTAGFKFTLFTVVFRVLVFMLHVLILILRLFGLVFTLFTEGHWFIVFFCLVLHKFLFLSDLMSTLITGAWQAMVHTIDSFQGVANL